MQIQKCTSYNTKSNPNFGHGPTPSRIIGQRAADMEVIGRLRTNIQTTGSGLSTELQRIQTQKRSLMASGKMSSSDALGSLAEQIGYIKQLHGNLQRMRANLKLEESLDKPKIMH